MFKRLVAALCLATATNASDLTDLVAMRGTPFETHSVTGQITQVGRLFQLTDSFTILASQRYSPVFLEKLYGDVMTTINVGNTYIIVDYNSNGYMDPEDEFMFVERRHGKIEKIVKKFPDPEAFEMFYRIYRDTWNIIREKGLKPPSQIIDERRTTSNSRASPSYRS